MLIHSNKLYAQTLPKLIINEESNCHINALSNGIAFNEITISVSEEGTELEISDRVLISEYNKREFIELEYLIVSNCLDTIVLSNCINNDTLNIVADYNNSTENPCANAYILKISWKVPYGKYYTHRFNSVDLSEKNRDARESVETTRDDYGNITRVEHYNYGNLIFEEVINYDVNQNIVSKTELNGDGIILRVLEYTQGILAKEVYYLDGSPHRSVNH